MAVHIMRRIGCIVLIVVFAALAAIAGWLAFGVAGTPREITTTSSSFTGLTAHAPPNARVLIIGDAGPFWMKVRNDALVTHLLGDIGTSDLDLAALLLGRAPFAVWTGDGGSGFAAEVTGLRRVLMLTIARFSDSIPPLHTSGAFVVSGEARVSQPRLYPPLEGEAIVLREDGESWLPGIDASALAISSDDAGIRLSAAQDPQPAFNRVATLPFTVPAQAPITMIFWEPTDLLRQIGKLLPLDLGAVGRDGVALSIYDVKSGGLLPGVEGLIILPAHDDARRAVAQLFSPALFPPELGLLSGEVSSREVKGVKIDTVRRFGTTMEAAQIEGMLVVALDGSSLDRFLSEPARRETGSEMTGWRLLADVERLNPVLSAIADDRAIRLLARDFQKDVKEFQSALATVPAARHIRAELRREPGRTVLEAVVGDDSQVPEK